MPANESANAIQRTIDARYATFSDALLQAVQMIGYGKEDVHRKAAFLKLLETGQALFDSFAKSDRPKWLAPILAPLHQYKDNTNSAMSFDAVKALLENYRDVKPVNLLEGPSSEFDFDAMFDRLREKHGLPSLFDRLASELTSILESGEVDSLAAVTALQKMIAALKANRDGSQTSMEVTFNYTSFAWYYMVEMLNLIPGIKQYTTAIDKTLAEGKAKMKNVREDLRDEAVNALVSGVHNIQKIAHAKPLLLSASDDYVEGEFEIKTPPTE